VSGTESRIQLKLERAGFRLDVDFGWHERVAVIFGPSGSGKSTLFHAALGLIPEARGRIQLGGVWLDDAERGLRLAVEDRALGWVPQDPTLFPHLSVAGNLRFGRRRAHGRTAPSVERAIEALEIGDLLERGVGELSGGERQRVAIARALAAGPRTLLLDEPLAALDWPLRARVLPYLLRVRDELDIPIVYITHDPDEAMLVGDIVVVLDRGRVVACGPPREVLWSRAVLPVSEALGLENAIDGRVVENSGAGSTVETRAGLRLVIPVTLPAGESVRLGLRAEDVLLSRDPPGRISARNAIHATVSKCEVSGDSARIHLDAGERLVAKVTPAAVDALELRPGVEVYAIIKAQALRLLTARADQPDHSSIELAGAQRPRSFHR
jgi:molybdate transport system ATP-binding protein